MRLAISTPTLFDKTSPFNHLFVDMLHGFIEAGFQVHRYVACRNDQEKDYEFGINGIQYTTFKRKDSSRKNIIKRYALDNITNIRIAHAIKKEGADVLLEDVTYCSFWTVTAAKKKGIRVVAMIQDVWPDNAVQSGLIKNNGILYRFFEWWQQRVYKRADKLICISEDMKNFIASKGVDKDKIEVIYNWGYSDDIVDIPWNKNEFVRKYNLSDEKFYAVYAGNIGKMQNVELVVRAAKRLEGNAAIHFLIIGDGAKREEIELLATDCSNVTMLPFQPSELAPHIYSMSGVNIIPLVEGGAYTAMPSKTGVVLSCGRPVVFCFGSETSFSNILQRYGAGISVSATDENELADVVLKYSKKYSKNNLIRNEGSDRFFMDYFVRSKNIRNYVRVLQSME